MAWQTLPHHPIRPASAAQMDLRLGELRLNGAYAHRGPLSVRLRPAEAKMLATLHAAAGDCVEHARLLAAFRSAIHACPNLLSVHICRLRRAIKPLGFKIESHVGVGYSRGVIDKVGA